jgi:hypothetical protein
VAFKVKIRGSKLFKISKKTYKLVWIVYPPAIIIGALSQTTFIPSHGYALFSYVFIWLFSIWLAVVSAPHMQAYMKKKNHFGKNISNEIVSLLAIVVFAHLNALFFFKTVPLITQYVNTYDHTVRYAIKKKGTKPARAFLACDQYLQLEDSFYYGKLCVTKEFFDTKGILTE